MKDDLYNNMSYSSFSSAGLDSSGISSISSSIINSSSNSIGCSICKCQHHQQKQKQLSQIQQNKESLIKLNVGGKRFITTRDTLLSKGENFFSSLLNGCIPSFKDEKDYYFIDRNGRYFNYILEFLRTGFVDIPSDINIESIFREADFYCITSFQLQWLAQQLHKSAAVSRAASSSRMMITEQNDDENNDDIINDNNNPQNNNTTVRRRQQLANQDLRWSLGALVERLLKI